MYWILFIGIAIISYLVQANLKNKFEKYSKMPLMNGMTGRDVAIKMLHDNGIYDVRVTSTPGMLTDHYNPANKTVNLSEGVYLSDSVAASCGGCSRMWPCCSACPCIRSVEDAFGSCSGGAILFFDCELGVVGGYLDGAIHAADSFGGHCLVCCNDFVQLHHSSGGNQCQRTRLGLDEQCRHHQCLQS